MKEIRLLIGLVFFATSFISAQQEYNGNYRALGLGGGYMYTIESSALNTNPSLLGWQGENYKQKLSINIAGMGLSTYAPLANDFVKNAVPKFISGDDYPFNKYGVVEEMLFSYTPSAGLFTTIDTVVSLEERQEFKYAILKQNSIKFNKLILGATYVTKNNGVLSFKINEETSIRFKASENLADLIAFGKRSSYFDTLVMIDGTHLANGRTYSNDTLNQIDFAFSNDTMRIKDLFGESFFEFVKYRNYSIGWGNRYAYDHENLDLFIGANLNVIEALNYSSFYKSFDDLTIAQFYKGKTEKKTPYGNSGLGLSVSFSGTAVYKKKTMISLGINNLGYVNWTKRKKTLDNTAVYSSGNDNSSFMEYPYGTSKHKDFNVQLRDAQFNWKSVNHDTATGRIVKSAPTNLHLGVRHNVGEVLSVGGSMIAPLVKSAPGSLTHTLLNFNTQLSWQKFTLFSGLSNTNKTVSIPFGFSIGSQNSKFETGIAVSDLLGYFNGEPKFSLAFGVKVRMF